MFTYRECRWSKVDRTDGICGTRGPLGNTGPSLEYRHLEYTHYTSSKTGQKVLHYFHTTMTVVKLYENTLLTAVFFNYIRTLPVALLKLLISCIFLVVV